MSLTIFLFHSILAFTVDRYIAACRPLLILKVCNWHYARKVVLGLWLFSFLYCAPWLGLTEVRPDPDIPGIEICDFRITKEFYLYWFVADLLLFYVAPLLFAAVIYTRLGIILRRSIVSFKVASRNAVETPENYTMDTRAGLSDGDGLAGTRSGNSSSGNMVKQERDLELVQLSNSGGGGMLHRQDSTVPLSTPTTSLPPEDAWVERPLTAKSRYGKLQRSRTRVRSIPFVSIWLSKLFPNKSVQKIKHDQS